MLCCSSAVCLSFRAAANSACSKQHTPKPLLRMPVDFQSAPAGRHTLLPVPMATVCCVQQNAYPTTTAQHTAQTTSYITQPRIADQCTPSLLIGCASVLQVTDLSLVPGARLGDETAATAAANGALPTAAVASQVRITAQHSSVCCISS